MLLVGTNSFLRFCHLIPNYEDGPLIAPNDIDLIASYEDINNIWFHGDWQVKHFTPTHGGRRVFAMDDNNIITEFEVAWPGSTGAELIELVKTDPEWQETGFIGSYHAQNQVPILLSSLNVLYALKMSHRFKKDSPHFLKTMRHIRTMRKIPGVHIPERYNDWFKRREAETYDYSHPKLNVRSDKFFNPEQVNYVYDHDAVHRIVAQDNEPAYTLFRKDGEEVAVDKNKWNALTYEQQLNSVLEETYVLSLERSQIPFKDKIAPKDSFLKALEKVCTSISSGWWREFAWENYEEVVNMYKESTYDNFWNAVQAGEVQKAGE